MPASSSCCSVLPAPGKSTLLNILGGLDRATSGTCRFKGLDLMTLDDSRLTAFRRDHIGFVFQFYNLIPSLTARENVALVTEIAQGSDDARGSARSRRARRSHGSLSGAAFRWRAAASRHCPRHRQAAGGAALRRADRRPRQQDRHSRAGGARCRQPGARHVDGDHHPQCCDPGDCASLCHLRRRPHCRDVTPTPTGARPPRSAGEDAA